MNNQLHALSMDEVRALAPSAFATEAHESRSNRYAFIPTAAVIEGLAGAGFLPFKASQSTTRTEGRENHTKHMVRFRRMENSIQHVGDSVPEVVMVNSHDGTSAYKLTAGIFRFVCSNGLVVADCTFGSVSIQHTGNIVEQVIDASHQIIDGSTKVLANAQKWGNLRLTNGEQNAFAEAARVLRFGNEKGEVVSPITAAQLLEPRRREDSGNDLWATYNRVQENAIKGGLRAWKRDEDGMRRRVTMRGVKGIDQDLKLNKALWTLADCMAEMKG
jgi:hypothetical protein